MSQAYLWALTKSEDIEKCFNQNCENCSSYHYLHQWSNESIEDFKTRVSHILANKIHETGEVIKKYKNNGMNGMLPKFPKGDKFYKLDTTAFESLSEKLASILLSCSDLDPSSYILYELVPLFIDAQFKIGCGSLNFKKEYPYEQILFYLQSQASSGGTFGSSKIFKVMNNMKDLEEKFELLSDLIALKTMIDKTEIQQKLLAMMAFDLLILNRDRHFGNLIILDDLKEKVNPVPLFDYGNSVIGGINSPEIRKNFFPKAQSLEDVFRTVRNQRDRMFNEPFHLLGEFTQSRQFFLYFDYKKLTLELEKFKKQQYLYHPDEVEISINFLKYCLERTEDVLWKRM